jgi:hypothetical protein
MAVFFFFSFFGWGETESTWYVGHYWPIVRAPDDRWWRMWTLGGMRIGRGNRSNRRKPALVPICPPQIPHDLTWVEPGPQRWDAGDYPPELGHGPFFISMKIYGRGRRAQSSPHIGSHHAKTSFNFSNNPSFLDCIFSFLRWKLHSKERGFRMLKTFRETWSPNWTLFLLRHFPTDFKNFLNESTNILIWAGDDFE